MLQLQKVKLVLGFFVLWCLSGTPLGNWWHVVHVTGPFLSSLSSACPLQRVNICSSFGPCDIASLLCSFSQRRWMSVGLPIRSNSTLISDQRWIAVCVIPLIPVTVFCQFETTTDSQMSCKRQHPIPDGGEWISMIWVFYTTKSVPSSIPMRLLWSLVLNDKWCRFRKNGFFLLLHFGALI